jgi:TolA-binding protein
LIVIVTAVAAAHAQPSEEVLAQRVYQQARSFASQGNYKEALVEFQRVVDTYPNSSVADDALLDLARYYFEIGRDPARASTLVEQIRSKYSATESAPDALVIAGRIALARSHQPQDLEAAFAQFDRVQGIYADSPGVPAALAYAGEARRLGRRLPEALERFRRVTTDFETSPAAAAAHFGTGMVLAAQGDPTGAMEEFQRVRNRWPDSREAASALGRITILFRLYVRAKSGPAFALSADPIGPPKADNVHALKATPNDVVYYATDSGVALLTAAGDRPPVAARPRTLTLDASGNIVVVEGNALRLSSGAPLPLTIPQPGKTPRPLAKIDAVVVTSSGNWLVMDEDEKVVNRFDASGSHAGTWASARLSRMAINEYDEVAGIERDSKNIVMFDPSGRVIAKIPPRGTGYEFSNPEDVAFDAFNHLYVLDRTGVIVFDVQKMVRAAATPATPPRSAAAAAPAAAATPVVTIFAEPEKSPSAIRRATAFTIDSAGRMYIADDRAQKIQLYR